MQYLKAWSAAPPKYRLDEVPAEAPEDVPTALQSTAMSSQDGPEDVPSGRTSEAAASTAE
jgi:hypothetical protein